MDRIIRLIQRMGIERYDDIWHIKAESFYKDPYESHQPGFETWHHDTFLIPFSNVADGLDVADSLKESDFLKEMKCHGVFEYSEYLPLGYLSFYVPVWYRDEGIREQMRKWTDSIEAHKTELKYCAKCKIKEEFGCLQCPVYPTIDRVLLSGLKDSLSFEEGLKVEIEKDDTAVKSVSRVVYRAVDNYKGSQIQYSVEANIWIAASINRQMICELEGFRPLRSLDASDRPLLGYGVDYIQPGTLKKAIAEKNNARYTRKRISDKPEKTEKKAAAADKLIEKLIEEA